MAITHQQAEAIRNWIPFPSAPSPPSPVASPSREKFLCNWPGSPTPSDSVSEVFWARAGLSCLSNDDLAEVACSVLLAQIPLTISSKPASVKIIKGFLRNLFDYGAPLKVFVYAGEVLARLPRTVAFAEEWRLMCPDHPPMDPYDINDPEGLDSPSLADSPHLPSYYPPLPRTPVHRAELLVLVALIAGASVMGSPLRPYHEISYWTLGVAGGMWSDPQLLAAQDVLYAWLDTVEIAQDGAWAIKAEMERVAELKGMLVTWL